jgi:hypothetical protein
MIDLSTKTIKKLFEEQVRALTMQTVGIKQQTFDYQFSGGWIR